MHREKRPAFEGLVCSVLGSRLQSRLYILGMLLYILICLTFILIKIKQPLKKHLGSYCIGFSVLMAQLSGQENKNSNFHNFLHGDMKNPDMFLNQRGLYCFSVVCRPSFEIQSTNKYFTVRAP